MENSAMESVAILWDIENVTPSANSQFVDGLLEFSQELGRITVCRVYGDWTRPHLGRLSRLLSENGFELIHIPVARKNSADISLITNAVELIYQYPHLSKIVLITGDADFRPLLYTLRRNGKDVHIICNSRNASEELLSLADSFKDYREIIPGEAAEAAEEAAASEKSKRRQDKPRSRRGGKTGAKTEAQPAAPEAALSEENAYRLLVEAVREMEKNKKKPGMGAVKVKLKILNPTFDEKAYGFKSWVDFVSSARDKKFIELVDDEQAAYLKSYDVSATELKTPLAGAFETLGGVLDELTKEKGKDFHSLASISTRLSDRFVDYGGLGYKRLKDFIFAAEKRDYVDVKYENTGYYVKKKG
jgi:uncharacterized protein (TIGR00288 family)